MKLRVGMEASGYARRFERLLSELQFELKIGDAAEVGARRVVEAGLPLKSPDTSSLTGPAHRVLGRRRVGQRSPRGANSTADFARETTRSEPRHSAGGPHPASTLLKPGALS